eukprot:SAG25_NODE_1250_length_3493_cov_3.243960_1_plen_30_part_00
MEDSEDQYSEEDLVRVRVKIMGLIMIRTD